jgi:hypothetical protein
MTFLVRRDRQREGRTLRIEFHTFGTPIQMLWTSTENLRNFWPSYRQCSWYQITVCQIHMDTNTVHCKTQMLWDGKIPISNTTLKFNHSEIHWDVLWLFSLLRHSHFFPDTSNSLLGNYLKAIRWMSWTHKESWCRLHVWTCRNTEIIQSSNQAVWFWLTLLSNQTNFCRPVCLMSVRLQTESI